MSVSLSINSIAIVTTQKDVPEQFPATFSAFFRVLSSSCPTQFSKVRKRLTSIDI